MSSGEGDNLNVRQLKTLRVARYSSSPPSEALLPSPDALMHDPITYQSNYESSEDEPCLTKMKGPQKEDTVQIFHKTINDALYVKEKEQSKSSTQRRHREKQAICDVDSPLPSSTISSLRTHTLFSDLSTPSLTATPVHTWSKLKKGAPTNKSNFDEEHAFGIPEYRNRGNIGILKVKNAGKLHGTPHIRNNIPAVPGSMFNRRRSSSDVDYPGPASSTTSSARTSISMSTRCSSVVSTQRRVHDYKVSVEPENGSIFKPALPKESIEFSGKLRLNLTDYMTPQEIQDCKTVCADNFEEFGGNEFITSEMIRSHRMIDIAFVQVTNEIDPIKITAANSTKANLLLFEDIMFCLKLKSRTGKLQLISQGFHSSGIVLLRKLVFKEYHSSSIFAMLMISALENPPLVFTIVFERKVQLTKWKNQLKTAIQKLDDVHPDEAKFYDRLNQQLATGDVGVLEACSIISNFRDTILAASKAVPPSMSGSKSDSETAVSGQSDALTHDSFLETDVGVLVDTDQEDNVAASAELHCKVKHKYGDMVLMDLGNDFRGKWPLVARIVQVDNNCKFMRIRWFASGGIFQPFDFWTTPQGRRMPTSVYKARSHFYCCFILDEGGYLPRSALETVMHRAKALGIDVLNRKPMSPKLTTMQRPFRKIERSSQDYLDVPRRWESWESGRRRTCIPTTGCNVLPKVGEMITVDLGEDWDKVWPSVAQVIDITDDSNSLKVRMYWSYDNNDVDGRFTRWRHNEGKGKIHALRKVRTTSHYACNFILKNRYYLPDWVKERALDYAWDLKHFNSR